MAIPTTEPTTFRAGETVIWTKSLADYSAADSWTLAYTLVNASNRYTTVSVITDPLDATGFKATLSATNSALVAAGTYQLVGLVSKAGEVHQVVDSAVVVQPAVTAVYDPRSTAKQSLDSVEAAILAFSQGGIQSYTISVGGSSRTVQRADLSQLFPLRDSLKAEVAREDAAAQYARTGVNPRMVKVRLSRV